MKNRYELSPQQKRHWLLQSGRKEAYVSRCLLKIIGHIQPERLAKVLNELAARHDILRTCFPKQAGLNFPVQQVNVQAAVSFEVHSHPGLPEDQHAGIIDPLYQATFPTPPGRNRSRFAFSPGLFRG